jgi:cytochrome c nitrite reductase small subunit
MTRRALARIVLACFAGVAAGIGSYTFVYARGGSYLSQDPAACANCHVMQDHYDAWLKSSHRSVAVCNDCHTPSGLIAKYATKASNGFWHSFAFTTGRFHEPIQITPRNQAITNDACRKCHADIVQSIEGPHQDSRKMSCLRCHGTVGHLN